MRGNDPETIHFSSQGVDPLRNPHRIPAQEPPDLWVIPAIAEVHEPAVRLPPRPGKPNRAGILPHSHRTKGQFGTVKGFSCDFTNHRRKGGIYGNREKGKTADRSAQDPNKRQPRTEKPSPSLRCRVVSHR